MRYTIRIKRQENKEAKPFWQEFEIEAEGELSIAAMLNELNARQKLTDKSGKEAEPISWECGCMVKKCGACAMRINGLPELACSTFLQSLKGKVIVLEPLSKFPVVKDLIVDRSVVFENLKKINLWLESDAYMTEYTHEIRYQSARCLTETGRIPPGIYRTGVQNFRRISGRYLCASCISGTVQTKCIKKEQINGI